MTILVIVTGASRGWWLRFRFLFNVKFAISTSQSPCLNFFSLYRIRSRRCHQICRGFKVNLGQQTWQAMMQLLDSTDVHTVFVQMHFYYFITIEFSSSHFSHDLGVFRWKLKFAITLLISQQLLSLRSFRSGQQQVGRDEKSNRDETRRYYSAAFISFRCQTLQFNSTETIN